MLIILYAHLSFHVEAYEYDRHNRRWLRIRNFVGSVYNRECYSLPHFLLAISFCLGRALYLSSGDAGVAGFDRGNSPVVFPALLDFQVCLVFRTREIALLSSFLAQLGLAVASRAPKSFRIFQNAGIE
jgi:hypothetical protein